MNQRLPTPTRLSGLLMLMTICAITIFMAILFWIATRLASEFDENARQDAFQRVEAGLQTMTDRLTATSTDYANWTEHYLAIRRRDYAWLDENVGSEVRDAGLTYLLILGGDPLDQVHGWSHATRNTLSENDYRDVFALSQTYLGQQSAPPGAPPRVTYAWIRDELWLLTIDRVVPHTALPGPVLPAATLILGWPVSTHLPRSLNDTLLLSDVRIRTFPLDKRASFALPVASGPPAWVIWTLPAPGTQAIHAVLVPMALALALLLLVSGACAFVARGLAAKLEGALDTATAANKAKSDFLTSMSHEIRTPLNGVLGMSELLAGTRLDENQRSMLDVIRHSCDNLLNIINDILDLARVESGKLTLTPAPFSLSTVITRVAALHGAIAGAKGVVFNVRRSADSPDIVVGDETRVLQILNNVLGNAVKFTDAGQIILEVARDADDHIIFRVSDTGIGMNDEQISRLFIPFEQAEAGTSRRFGGSGLGMSIARQLIEIMAGSIMVDSQSGQGTVVTIRLPAPPADAVAPGVPPAPDAPPGAAGSMVPATDTAAPAMAAAAPGGPPPGDPGTAPAAGARTSPPPVPDPVTEDRLNGVKLLVAEDNATNRKILSLMLDPAGVQITFAGNGAEACALVQAQDFDLILMDIAMPVMDGFAALAEIRRRSRAAGREAPHVIAVTANVMAAQIAAYRAAGFADIVPKPIRRAELRETLLRQLAPDPAAPP